MATSSTAGSPSVQVHQELTKLQPVEFSSRENSFSETRLDGKYDECLSSHLKTLAPKDKKLQELIPRLEAEERIQYAAKRIEVARRTFLKEEADKIKISLEGRKDEGSAKEEESKLQVFVPIEMLEIQAEISLVTQIEVQSLTCKLWLRRIQFIQQRDKLKYKDLQDFERAILGAKEIIKEYRSFIHKRSHFDREKLETGLNYQDRLKSSLVEALKEKEKSKFEMLEDDVLRFLSNWDRINALLGLRVDFLDRLEDVPLEDRDHLTLCDWIVTFLRKNFESVGLTDKSCPSKELLASIGFDPLSSAVETIMARARNLQQHIDVCELAEIYIKDEFKYNLLLSPVAFRFPLQSNLTNSWFQLPRNIDVEEEVANQVWHVNILNLVTEESLVSGTTRSKLSDLISLKDGKNVILFHGTDHQSACEILFRGIDLCQGRQKRDFSCGSGFYLTDNSEEALNWAKNTTAKPALLVFKVNRQEYLDHAEKLNLFENEQRWIEIVSSFRSGNKTAKTRKSLRAYDLIEGPVARKRRNEVSDETVYDPKPSSYQMCLNSDDFADTFRKTLHSIIFLKIC